MNTRSKSRTGEYTEIISLLSLHQNLSPTGEYTEIISLLSLHQNLELFGAGNELVYPNYHVYFLNPGLAYLAMQPL